MGMPFLKWPRARRGAYIAWLQRYAHVGLTFGVPLSSFALADERFISKVQVSEWGLKYDLNKEIIVSQRALNRMTGYVEHAVYCIYDNILHKFGAS